MTADVSLTRADLVARELRSLATFVREAAATTIRPGARVLDYGCGTPSTCREVAPYRAIVEALGGQWEGWDIAGYPDPVGPYDVLLCTQVIQCVDNPLALLKRLRGLAAPDGRLILTYPTTWYLCERWDRWRFTPAAIEDLLAWSGWRSLDHRERWALTLNDIKLPGGGGVVAG